MMQREPSQTAKILANARAVHLVLDGDPKVYEDTLAHALAAIPDDAVTGLNDPWWREWRGNALRALAVSRSRFTEDKLNESRQQHNVDQYIILGAGLDSFAYRRPSGLAHVSVFEVDHPATQEWKRNRLRDLGITVSDNVHFVPVDFGRDRLPGALWRAGLQKQRPTLVSLLGVSYYLTQAALEATLAETLESVDGYCQLVLDFVVPAEMLAGADRELLERTMKDVANVGESWVGLYQPAQLEIVLRAAGFDTITYVSPAESQARYFGERTDELRLCDVYHLMCGERGK